MKILLTSYFFHPSIGGIETVSRRLAQDFAAAGHEVRVATFTPFGGEEDKSYQVVRRPGPLKLLELARWCDVYFQNNISLALAWPLLVIRRPWVIAHHTYIARVDLTIGWRDRIKRFLLRFARNITISDPIARSLPVPSVVIGNPYDDQLFRVEPGSARDIDLVFVGRLVSDKGVDLLLESLIRLRGRGVNPRLTIVGEGPEFPALQRYTRENELERQVTFVGYKTGRELVCLLNQHRVMVVPSRWPEPFGLVALEGIACGCAIVGSEGGGLKDAIGPCGWTFPNNSLDGLTDTLAQALAHPEETSALTEHAAKHLEPYRRSHAATRYMEIFLQATR